MRAVDAVVEAPERRAGERSEAARSGAEAGPASLKFAGRRDACFSSSRSEHAA